MNSSITDKCPGDVISVLCSTTYNEMEWVWQSNELTESFMYFVHRLTTNQLNIPHNFNRIQSVTTSLLNDSAESLYLKSSLQYVVSSEYPEANIECNDFMAPSETIHISNKSE